MWSDHEQLQEMSRTLAEAIQDCRVVTVKVYHQYGAQDVAMLPVRIDLVERKLRGRNAEGKVPVSLGDVLGLE